MKATEILMHEHELIMRGVTVLDRMADKAESGQPVPVADANAIIEFIRKFADGCHHAKEEGVLFPAMEAAGMPRDGGPIAVMLAEHDQGRAAVKAMSAAASAFGASAEPLAQFARAARAYANLLTNHIHKENNILFRMADQVIGAHKDAEILQAYDEHEARVTGPGEHERFHKVIDELEAAYPG
ncbi:MAG: hemerythrin domain-containing protein [Acidobacteria bacterium]|nr:hemerythrin domain-containing protein [Acidobacteriota bacterium]